MLSLQNLYASNKWNVVEMANNDKGMIIIQF